MALVTEQGYSIVKAAQAVDTSENNLSSGRAASQMFDAHALPRKAISFGGTLPGYWWKLVSKNAPKEQPIVIEALEHDQKVTA